MVQRGFFASVLYERSTMVLSDGSVDEPMQRTFVEPTRRTFVKNLVEPSSENHHREPCSSLPRNRQPFLQLIQLPAIHDSRERNAGESGMSNRGLDVRELADAMRVAVERK